MQLQTICVLGGTGFIGSSIVNQLVRHGYQVVIPTRNREKNRNNLILLPGVELIQADIYDQRQLSRLFSGCDAAINCVGILNESRHDGSGFRKAHVELVKKAIEATRATNLRRFIQISTIGANATKGNSHYLRSKGEAEMMLRASPNLDLSIIRPSMVFGPGDGFFLRFAKLLKYLPVLPLPCPQARMAPLYVRDLATAVVKIMELSNSATSYELCGMREYTMLDLVRYTAKQLGLRRSIIPLNNAMSFLQALVCEYLPGKPFSMSIYYSTQTPSVADKAGGDMLQLGIEPQALEAIVPDLLRPFKS